MIRRGLLRATALVLGGWFGFFLAQFWEELVLEWNAQDWDTRELEASR